MTHHLFNVRFPHDVWEGVKSAAESERRSVHQWVLLAVEDGLANKAGELEMDAPGVREAVRAATVERLVESGVVSRGLPPHNADPKDKAAQEHGRRERRPKSGVCVHRVPAGSFCKRCEEG